MNKNLSSPPRQDWFEQQETWRLALEREVRRQVVDGKHKEGWYSPEQMDRLSDDTI